MTTETTNTTPQWKITALTEALGDLELTVTDTLTIGRSTDNDVVLGSKQVSRQHAQLEIKDGELFVTDLGSSNGTFVNEVKLTENEAKQLKADDLVSFATFSFQVKDTAETEDKSEAIGEVTHVAQQDSNEETGSNVDVENLTEPELADKLTTELEAPIAIGDPNQPQVTEKDQHFAKLAEQADPELHKANQAATSQLSATTQVEASNEQIADKDKTIQENNDGIANATNTDAKLVESTAAAMVEEKAVEKMTTDEKVVTKTAAKKTVIEEKIAKHPNNDFNTVTESQEHKVAHVNQAQLHEKNKTPSAKRGYLWFALILLGLALALWLYNSGNLG